MFEKKSIKINPFDPSFIETLGSKAWVLFFFFVFFFYVMTKWKYNYHAINHNINSLVMLAHLLEPLSLTDYGLIILLTDIFLLTEFTLTWLASYD